MPRKTSPAALRERRKRYSEREEARKKAVASDTRAEHFALAGVKAIPTHLLDETIADWQPLSRRALTREDAREIIYNLTGFFAVLREWHRADAVKKRTATLAKARNDKLTMG